MTFSEALAQQRWDDHRYYHHSRINQSLHLVSALTFLVAYVMVAVEPAAAVLLAWLVAMPSRQIGHFFFEPLGYDEVNRATHEYKERIKVGYNLRRKAALLSIWALSPLVLLVDPTMLGAWPPAADWRAVANQVAIIWLVVAAGAIVFRSVQLFFLRDVQTGLVWATKILTDPFHDVKLYYRSPLYLLRGQFVEPAGSERVA
jgi:hypothetical protein